MRSICYQKKSLIGLKPQSGAVLIVGLIMVLLMTIMGLAAIRGSGMQELMAGNMRDRNLAFQSAEAGLRMAETVVGSSSLVFDGTLNGYYSDLNIPAATYLPPTTWTKDEWAARSVQPAITLPGIATAPRYIVEELMTLAVDTTGNGGCVEFGCNTSEPPRIFYRVTSRGTGGTDTTEVLLQTTYIR